MIHFFNKISWQLAFLWSENKVQKLKAVKFSLIFVSTSLYCLKTLLQPRPSLNHEINQNFLIHSRRWRSFWLLPRTELFEHFTILAMFLPPCSRQHVQTFLPLTSAAEVMELVAAGSRETSKRSLPSADPVMERSEGHPWRNQGAARRQRAARRGRQWRLVQQRHQLRRCSENGGAAQRLKPGGKKRESEK